MQAIIPIRRHRVPLAFRCGKLAGAMGIKLVLTRLGRPHPVKHTRQTHGNVLASQRNSDGGYVGHPSFVYFSRGPSVVRGRQAALSFAKEV